MRPLPLIACAALGLALALAAPAMSADLFVSPAGSDQWSGSLSEPNAQGTDGPFATLERARDAVRTLKAKTAGREIVVQIRGGHYPLGKTVVFGVEDSVEGEATVTYEAFPGETPVFSSDVELTGWTKPEREIPSLPAAEQGKVWVRDIPPLNGSPWQFYTLYDDQDRLARARSEGFVPASSSADPGSRASKSVLHFPSGTMRAWPHLDDVEIVVRPHHAWVVNILPLASVDLESQLATTTIQATYAMDELHFLKGSDSAWVENVIEALDQPGEWVLDRRVGKLYLWPRGDGPPQGIVAPRLREFLRLEGRIDVDGPTDTPVRNLVFRGLTFTRGDSYRVDEDDRGLQHDWEMHDKANALLRLRGAENCVIERCHFVDSGGTAIRVDLHGRQIRIRDNHIEHIGATGILLCGYGAGTKDVNGHNLLFNMGTMAEFYDQGRTPRLEAAWAHEADTDYNLYFCAGDPDLSRATLRQARRSGIDTHSLATDPLFVDPANGDFRLKPDSPALKLGFTPIDRSEIGWREPR